MSRVRDAVDRLVHWYATRRIYGPRCRDFDDNCVVCYNWLEHDILFSDIALMARAVMREVEDE